MSERLIIGTTFNYDIPFPEMAGMIAEAGFSGVTLGGGDVAHSRYDRPEGRREIIRVLRENELDLHSIHAPISEDADISSPSRERAERGLKDILMTLDGAAETGAGMVIFHPCWFAKEHEYEDRRRTVLDAVPALIDAARSRNVVPAMENLPGDTAMKLFADVLNEFRTPLPGVCYDSSHDNLRPRPLEMLDEFGDRVVCLHLSDNRGKGDDHLLPFEGVIDWGLLMGELKSTGFDGEIMLEPEMRESAFADPAVFLEEAFNRGRRLLSMLGKF